MVVVLGKDTPFWSDWYVTLFGYNPGPGTRVSTLFSLTQEVWWKTERMWRRMGVIDPLAAIIIKHAALWSWLIMWSVGWMGHPPLSLSLPPHPPPSSGSLFWQEYFSHTMVEHTKQSPYHEYSSLSLKLMGVVGHCATLSPFSCSIHTQWVWSVWKGVLVTHPI